jgi:hypothetical protein
MPLTSAVREALETELDLLRSQRQCVTEGIDKRIAAIELLLKPEGTA